MPVLAAQSQAKQPPAQMRAAPGAFPVQMSAAGPCAVPVQMGAAKVRGTVSTRRGTVRTHGGLCTVPVQLGAAKVRVGCGCSEQMCGYSE
jgi:hypothetical protein